MRFFNRSENKQRQLLCSALILVTSITETECVYCAVGTETVYIIPVTFRQGGRVQILVTALTNQNTIQEEIRSRLKSGNASYNSVQNICLPDCYPKIYILR